jgi:hypothetical protein
MQKRNNSIEKFQMGLFDSKLSSNTTMILIVTIPIFKTVNEIPNSWRPKSKAKERHISTFAATTLKSISGSAILVICQNGWRFLPQFTARLEQFNAFFL